MNLTYPIEGRWTEAAWIHEVRGIGTRDPESLLASGLHVPALVGFVVCFFMLTLSLA